MYDLLKLFFIQMHCIFIDLVFYCHTFYTWASGSDDRGSPIPRIDVNKLIDWLIDWTCDVLKFDQVINGLTLPQK